MYLPILIHQGDEMTRIIWDVIRDKVLQWLEDTRGNL